LNTFFGSAFRSAGRSGFQVRAEGGCCCGQPISNHRQHPEPLLGAGVVALRRQGTMSSGVLCEESGSTECDCIQLGMPNLYDRTEHPFCAKGTARYKVAFKTDIAVFANERGFAVLTAGGWHAVQRKGHGQTSVIVAAREIRLEAHLLPFSVDLQRTTELSPLPIGRVRLTGQFLCSARRTSPHGKQANDCCPSPPHHARPPCAGNAGPSGDQFVFLP